MRLSIAAIAACAGTAQAFKDTSPFLLFSNSPVPKELPAVSRAQLQSSSSVLKTAKSLVHDCPSDIYYIISQPSLSSSDLSSPNSTPQLRRALKNPDIQFRYSVAEVLGLETGNVQDLVQEIDAQCSGVVIFNETPEISDWTAVVRPENKLVVLASFKDLPNTRDERRESLADHDFTLEQSLNNILLGYKYTVIFTSTPPSLPIQPSADIESDIPLYESEFENLQHLDLKRDMRIREDNSSLNAADLLPLFEKYQFLTPGLFMGLLVGFILIAILSVALSAIGSLQVSYGAFDKDMGPAAQKKQ